MGFTPYYTDTDNLKADVWRWRAAANSCLILWYVSAHNVIKPATTHTQKNMTNILRQTPLDKHPQHLSSCVSLYILFHNLEASHEDMLKKKKVVNGS